MTVLTWRNFPAPVRVKTILIFAFLPFLATLPTRLAALFVGLSLKESFLPSFAFVVFDQSLVGLPEMQYPTAESVPFSAGVTEKGRKPVDEEPFPHGFL